MTKKKQGNNNFMRIRYDHEIITKISIWRHYEHCVAEHSFKHT